MRIFKKIRKYILSSISRKFIFFYLFCLIIPLIFLSIIFGTSIRSTLMDRELAYTNEKISYINSQMDRIFADMESIAASIISNSAISQTIANIMPAPTYEWHNQVSNVNSLLSTIAAYNSYKYVITILGINNQVYNSDRTNLLLRTNSPLIEQILESNDPITVVKNEEKNLITFCQKIYYLSSVSGVILIDVSLSEIEFLFSANQDSQLYILDSHNSILYTSDHDYNEYVQNEIVYAVKNNSSTVNFYNTEHLIQYSSPGKNGISIAITVPTQSVYKESKQVIDYFIYACITIAIIAMLGSYFLANILSKDLKSLTNHVLEFGKKPEAQICTDISAEDEVGQLSSRFSYMSYQIVSLLDQIKESERSKRLLYFQTLQAQINPHMIYNTLNTITYLAELQNVDNIKEVSSSFAELLHSISGTKGEFITVTEEINYIKAYINIKKYNILADIDVKFNIQKEAKNCKILKLLLQPIIENSITHGFKGRIEPCLIDLRIAKENNYLIIDIKDNGNGCDSETIDKILNGEMMNKGMFVSIGIHNIIERLQLQYEDYKFEMTGDSGVSVHIEYPL